MLLEGRQGARLRRLYRQQTPSCTAFAPESRQPTRVAQPSRLKRPSPDASAGAGHRLRPFGWPAPGAARSADARTRAESGHVQAPYLRGGQAGLGDRLVPALDEVGAPGGKCARVVPAQVLLVLDLQALVLHRSDDRAHAGQLTVREHVAVDEAAPLDAGVQVVLPGDRVVQQPAAGHQPRAQEPEVGRVVAHPDVLGQADRAHRVEPGLGDLAVVLVADLRAVPQAVPLDRRLRPLRLVAREGHAERRHAVLAYRVPHHAAPAAPDVEQAHPRLQAELAGDEVELVLLRLLQRGVVRGVAGAGVRHRLAEHDLVEPVAHVVVVADRLGVTGARVPQPVQRSVPAAGHLVRRRRRHGQGEPPEGAQRAGRVARRRSLRGEQRLRVQQQFVRVARMDPVDLEVLHQVGASHPERGRRPRDVGQTARAHQPQLDRRVHRTGP